MTSVNVTSLTNTVSVTEGDTRIVTITTAGPQGPGGGTGGAAAYVHTQNIASATWTINHLLGFSPSVDVYDSGSQQITAEVSHTSLNQTVILCTTPTAGFARLT